MNFPIEVFNRAAGNADNYRIPSLVRTKSGALVACADERFFTGSDNPNRIDKVVRISHDNGATWGEQITVVKCIGLDKEHSTAAIDPAMLYDDETNTIFMLYSFTPAGVGILNCEPGTGYRNGNLVVTCGKKSFEVINGELFSEGKPSGLTMDDDGNLSDGKSNVFLRNNKFAILKTSYLMLTKSTDEGKSWSKPTCLNSVIKEPNWCFLGSGPAQGLKLSGSSRLTFQIYYGLRKMPMNLTCATMYSDDRGATWHKGKTPPIKGRFPKNKPVIMPQRTWLTESQTVEVEPGKLLCFMRNHHPARRIMVAESKDGGESWSEPKLHPDLPQCVCQITAIAFDCNGKRLIATVNAASTKKREKGVIRISEDGGMTFPYSYLITEGEFVYSSAVFLAESEELAILYEDSTEHKCIKFTRVAVKDILKA